MKRFVLYWLASLVVASLGMLAIAQTRLPEPRLLSGNDIAFRVEGSDAAGKPVGQFMLRMNGNWVEIGSQLTVRPAK